MTKLQKTPDIEKDRRPAVAKDEKPAVVTRTDEHFTARFLCGAHLKRYITFVDKRSGLQVTGKVQSIDHSSRSDISMFVYEDEDPTSVGYTTLSRSNTLFHVGPDDEVTIHGADPRKGK